MERPGQSLGCGAVWCRARSTGTSGQIRTRGGAGQISSKKFAKLFEEFWRGDGGWDDLSVSARADGFQSIAALSGAGRQPAYGPWPGSGAGGGAAVGGAGGLGFSGLGQSVGQGAGDFGADHGGGRPWVGAAPGEDGRTVGRGRHGCVGRAGRGRDRGALSRRKGWVVAGRVVLSRAGGRAFRGLRGPGGGGDGRDCGRSGTGQAGGGAWGGWPGGAGQVYRFGLCTDPGPACTADGFYALEAGGGVRFMDCGQV